MIESEWIPAYAAEGFSAVAVYAGESPAFGQFVARHTDVREVDLAWDLEWEVFNQFRVPRWVFSLRVVVDRDGIVVGKFTDEDLAETQATLEAGL